MSKIKAITKYMIGMGGMMLCSGTLYLMAYINGYRNIFMDIMGLLIFIISSAKAVVVIHSFGLKKEILSLRETIVEQDDELEELRGVMGVES